MSGDFRRLTSEDSGTRPGAGLQSGSVHARRLRSALTSAANVSGHRPKADVRGAKGAGALEAPVGGRNRPLSQRIWETFGWSSDGKRVLGIARGDGRRLWLQQLDIDSGVERPIADLGPVPPAFDLTDSMNDFPYRGFSLHPDGRRFLTSVLRMRTQIYLMRDFDRRTRLIDRLFLR
jgi:hypothetical protein